MHVLALNLANFRNYEKAEFHPSEGLNILVGLNAQGKSAVLESLYLLATSKSHRTSRDADMIKLGESFARVCAKVSRTARTDVVLEMVLSRSEKKSIKIDRVKHGRIGELVGQLNAVIFSNSDIDMVKGEPSLRRRFLNLEISQISPGYIHSLARYKRVLDQRNNLLKEIKAGAGQASGLAMWDKELAAYGAEIIARRAKFAAFLAGAATKIYSVMTDGSEALGVAYKPNVDVSADSSVEEIAEKFSHALQVKKELDIARGTTNSGPHRDDLDLTVNGIAAREYGSQGQQRTAAMSLKLAEIEMMEEAVGESPVVLLDDAAAELDEKRRAHVFDLTLGRCQTLVTATSLEEIDDGAVTAASVFEVKSGEVALI